MSSGSRDVPGQPQLLDIEGWYGLPVPVQWAPFRPNLQVSIDLSAGRNHAVNRETYGYFGTPRLDRALEHFAALDYRRVLYHALPAERVTEIERTVDPEVLGSPWQAASA
jgi:hypothetical protein